MPIEQQLNIHDLVLKSIENYTRLETKVNGMHEAMQVQRSDNKEILEKINKTLERLAEIQEKLSTNASDHLILHKRIDDMKADMEAMEADVHTISVTCKSSPDIRKKVESIEADLAKLKHSHEACQERQKEERTWKQERWGGLVDKVVWAVVILLAITAAYLSGKGLLPK